MAATPKGPVNSGARDRQLSEELAALPPGQGLERTCAIVFTDVVDSTLMSARIGDAAAARQWAAHDNASRDSLRRWGGVEIDRSDGMLLLFDQPADALEWAREYHGALGGFDPPMKSRAGVHVGPLVVRRNPAEHVAVGAKLYEADGLAKPLAARIMALAGGGQTLLSHAAREALDEGALRVHSHGHWQLKGVPDPVELFEDSAAGEWRPPAEGEKAHRVLFKDGGWVPARDIPHTLPAQRNAFVGREAPLRELWQSFEAGARLVTLTGVGGTGKTRLAIGFGARARGAFTGGVWFCDLSQARDAAGVAGAVARGLDVTLDKGDPAARVAEVIAARGHCLIILDNTEQVIPDVAQAIAKWLDGSPAAAFLVTSRQSLGVQGERVQVLDPLSTQEAQELFRSRAGDAAPGLALGSDDEAALRELVQMLDGLPLAIELAAARARVMRPRALVTRMNERFRLLAAPGARDGRQATLRATFDWSWDLLAESERTVLAQLSVFEGGFGLDDAEAVVDVAQVPDAAWLPDLVQSLFDKSLVRPLPHERFGLLVSVREYAAEQLRTTGRFTGSGPDAETAVVQRMVSYFASAGEDVVTLGTCANLDNAVAACRHAVAHGWVDGARGALTAAWAGLALRGPASSGLELARAVEAMPGAAEAGHAAVARVLGSAELALGNVAQAEAHLSRALEMSRAAADRGLEAAVQLALGHAAIAQARAPDALARYSEAAVIARSAGERAIECEATNGIGNVHYIRSESTEARRVYLDALRIAGGLEWLQCAIHSNLGNVAMGQGELEAAQPELEAAVALARQCGRRAVEANTLCNLGWLAHLRGDPARSIEFSEAALDVSRHLGNPNIEGVVLCNLAIADEAAGDAARALQRFEEAVAMTQRVGDTRREGQFLNYFGMLHLRQRDLAAARACLERGERLLRAGDDRMSLATILCALAQLEHAQGRPGDASSAWEEARAIAGELGALPGSELGLALAEARAALDR
jgi:predicted ATPase/class 3 adenylate cyclase